jgi:hypothetical protein
MRASNYDILFCDDADGYLFFGIFSSSTYWIMALLFMERNRGFGTSILEFPLS